MPKSLATAVVVSAKACPCLNAASRPVAAQAAQVTGDTTFCRAPLIYAAARGLGCGSRAKPVVFDREAAVEQAWLNKTGEPLAVIWASGSQPRERQATLAAC